MSSSYPYLLVTPPTLDTALFSGASQYNQCNKNLNNLLQKRQYVLRSYGINVDHIGVQLARKRSSTYITSGCGGGPMQQTDNIRCGWRMAGATDTFC